MPEHSAARFVQDEVAQRLVAPERLAHFPQGFAGRRGDAADDHVADFAFGMGRDDVDGFRTAQGASRGGGKVRGRGGNGKRPAASDGALSRNG